MMRIPFIVRLKWIRLKSWIRTVLGNKKNKGFKYGWVVAMGLLWIGAVWLLTGCAPQFSDGGPKSLESTVAAKMPTPTTVATIQPTAIEPTLVPSPSATPIDPWENFPAPTETSAIAIRRPAHPHERNDQLITFILLGSDQRPGEYGHRSDVVMLICVDPVSKTVQVLSIPRDLYVFIPGWRVDRINVADGRGGPELVADTILYNFGLEVDHWVRVDFRGFVTAVDSLGGIEVEVGEHLSDFCGRYWSYTPGVYHMDGFQALCYVRMRKASSDFDRLRREQEVAHAIFQRILSLDGLSRLPDLFRQYEGLVETDIDLQTLVSLLPVAVEASQRPNQIKSFTVGPELSTPWRVPSSGASVVLPNWETIGDLLEGSFGLPEQSWQ